MILIINVCKERLHYFEFVKPVEEILIKEGQEFETIIYSKLTPTVLAGVGKVIICGTSLKDNSFLKDIKKFSWIKKFNKPILGICAGMQIIGLVFGGKVKKLTEIGFFRESFNQEFLGLLGEQEAFSQKNSMRPAVKEVYHLHNNFVDFKKVKDFEIFSENKSFVHHQQ